MSRVIKIAQLIVNLNRQNDKCLRALYYFFKVLGLAPYGFTIEDSVPNANIKNWKFTHSRISVAYNIAVTSCIAISSYFILVVHDFFFKYKEFIFLQMISTWVLFSSTCIVGTFSARYGIQIDVCNKLNEMRGSIYEESRSHNNCWKTDISRKIKLMILFHTLVWLGFAASVFFVNPNYNAFLFAIDANHFVCSTMVLQYVVAAKLIDDLFVNLHRCIVRALRQANQSCELTMVVKTAKDLSRLWKYYDDLRQMSIDVANFFSFAMLLVTVTTFAIPTTTIYYMIAKPIVCGGLRATNFDYAFGTFHVLRYVYPYVLLTTSISAVVDESNKTRDIIFKFLREARSSLIAEKMTRFVIYLMKDNVQFTIFDLIPLNGSFIFAMVGTGASYLIIIIQFQAQICELHSAGL